MLLLNDKKNQRWVEQLCKVYMSEISSVQLIKKLKILIVVKFQDSCKVHLKLSNLNNKIISHLILLIVLTKHELVS